MKIITDVNKRSQQMLTFLSIGFVNFVFEYFLQFVQIRNSSSFVQKQRNSFPYIYYEISHRESL